MTEPMKPRLRTLDFQPVLHHGERMWLLQDPWQLSNRQLIVPHAIAQMLLLCDGTRTPEEIRAELTEELGAEVPFDVIANTLSELERNFLLHGDQFQIERSRALNEYRSHPHRLPALAGLGYPASPTELTALFESYNNISQAPAPIARKWRGVVSPHIDYQRGGPVYAQVWREAEHSVLDAELVLIFGTDHNGSTGTITLTRQPYATPFGVLPNDIDLTDKLAEAIGTDSAYAEELNHRNEHSIELSAVWLHYIFQQANCPPCPMVPILVGSFHHFLSNGHHPANEPVFRRFLDTLRRETAGRRVLAVGSVDLAHVGPAFGDPFAMDTYRRAALREEDHRLMSAITRGSAAEFYNQILSARDRNRICGFAPLYHMLRYLDATSGVQICYDQCPADQTDSSLVSICGLLLN